jgi:hypothetical protein
MGSCAGGWEPGIPSGAPGGLCIPARPLFRHGLRWGARRGASRERVLALGAAVPDGGRLWSCRGHPGGRLGTPRGATLPRPSLTGRLCACRLLYGL